MKKDNKFAKKSELSAKPANSGNTGQRDTKEVLAELLGRLREKLNPKVPSVSPSEERRRDGLSPNLDCLTVGVVWESDGVSTAFWMWKALDQKRTISFAKFISVHFWASSSILGHELG